tara:strand:- start:485 stop:898 length:414 start_codon:yes stop_codon:yes gene_type:complete
MEKRYKKKNMKVNMLTADSELLEKEFKVIINLPLINVFQIVGKRSEQDGYDKLRRDVEENGFIKPIIIINNTIENYNLAIRKVNKSFVRFWQEHKPYLCIYGNQRIDIALKLRIFHLDAILTPNIEWAHAAYLKINE